MKAHKFILTALMLLAVGASTFAQWHVKRDLRHQKKCIKWGVCKQVENTVVYKETVKIDTVVTDNSELWLSLLFNCDSNNVVTMSINDSLSTENINLKMLLKNNVLTIGAKVPTRYILVPHFMKSMANTIVQERFTNILTTWQSFWVVMGKIFAGSILLTLIVGLLWLRFKR